MAQLRAAGCVWAEDEARVLCASARDFEQLALMAASRCRGEPLEQIVGWALFDGVQVSVAPGVFVPRRRSTALVAVAASLRLGAGAVVVDLGCGTGALGAALLARADVALELHAADLDPVAVGCAITNLPPASAVHQGDLFDALPPTLRGRVNLVLANAPYVPSDEVALLPAEARIYEHRLALDGGPDGLDVHRRIAAEIGSWLAPGGTVLIEVSEGQREVAAALLATAGLDVTAHRDEALEALVLSGTRAG